MSSELDHARAELVIRFYERALRHAKGRWAGRPFILEDWQKNEILIPLFGTTASDGRRWYREALIGVARKNGKSELAAGLALFFLTVGGEPGGEVYSLAGSRDQARIVYNVAKAMVEGSPLLAKECRTFRSVIEHPASGSIYRVLAADARLAHGYNPVAAIVDELHVHKNGDLYEAMKSAGGAREEPMLVSITTAGADEDSICRRLYLDGLAGKDPRLLFRWWEAPKTADLSDRSGWRAANPASWITDEFLEGQLQSAGLHESSFRRLHLNQWTEALQAWFPMGAFEARAVDRRLEPFEEVVLGFDGSFAGDSTALVAATLDDHLEVLGLWEKPEHAGDDWRVNIADVEDAIRKAATNYTVIEVAADPFRWQRSMQALAAEGIPVVEYPTTAPARMVPATAKFYDAVMSSTLTHEGHPRLCAHVAHCVLKTDHLGPRITKDYKSSSRKIDLAVAAVAAYDRATQRRENPPLPCIY